MSELAEILARFDEVEAGPHRGGLGVRWTHAEMRVLVAEIRRLKDELTDAGWRELDAAQAPTGDTDHD